MESRISAPELARRLGDILGRIRYRGDSRRRRIDALVTRCPVVDSDRAIAARWAELFARLSTDGRMIPANALVVAATALHLDFGVLVGPKDEAHYQRIAALRCVRLPAS